MLVAGALPLPERLFGAMVDNIPVAADVFHLLTEVEVVRRKGLSLYGGELASEAYVGVGSCQW